MRSAGILVAVSVFLAADAYACPPVQKNSRHVEKDGCVAVKPVTDKARPANGDISAADKENLNRAMSRNVLQSIDDQLRRQRLGK